MRALLAIELGALAAFVALGCRPYPLRPVVEAVELEPGEQVDTDAIRDGLATAETPYLFGVLPRVLEYETYDPSVLARDLERIERAYRARGYYEAKVTAARVIHVDEHYVRIEIRIHEGKPVRVKSRGTPGLSLLPLQEFAAATEAIRAINLKEGDVFEEERFEQDKRAVERALRSQGFAFAKVEGRAQVDIAKHSADVVYLVDPGPAAYYGEVRIVGLKEIPEGPVRDALILKQGARYSSADVEDAEQALINLGVFSRVEIREDRQHRERAVVPLTVVVEESNLRTIRLGGGTRLDVLRVSFHLRAGWENRNFLGGMRSLSVEARPGLTLFPTSITRPQMPVRLLPEFRVLSELRQPSFFEGRTTGFLAGQYSLFPVLYPLPDGADPKTEPILGYHEVRASTGVERQFFRHALFVSPSYNWQGNFPFYYQDPLGGAPDLSNVRASFPELRTRLDVEARDDLRFELSNSVQVAGYVFQGTVSDVRVRPELRTFLRNVFGRKTELATRIGFGFLFPSDYGDDFDTTFEGGQPRREPTDPAVVLDQQKMLLRGFYSGGPTSNRGYPLRGVGPHGPVGFLLPRTTASINCSDPNEPERLTRCTRPIGGLTLWELSLEGRFPISGPFGGVVFVDASDLTPYRLDGSNDAIRFDVPHLSPGLGLRYTTPVGPLRLDLAYRVPYAQQIGRRTLAAGNGSPTGEADQNFLDNYWLPLSLHFAIGEAFD